MQTTTIILISEGGTNFQSTQYLAKSQCYQGLEFVWSDIKIYEYMLIYCRFQESVCVSEKCQALILSVLAPSANTLRE